MNCTWRTLEELPDGRRVVVCPVCGTKHVQGKVLVRRCRPRAPDVIGVCHICRRTLRVDFCGLCKHWLCKSCQPHWLARGRAAIEAFFCPRPNCCGPNAVHAPPAAPPA